jgi:glycerol-3-phosphate acyltransferase PlsY
VVLRQSRDVEVAIYSVVLLLAYLIGSLPTGYLLARMKATDIRTVGSGNIGATNVFRILGKGSGIFVLAVDAAKGVLATLALPPLANLISPGMVPKECLELCGGIGAILGHNYTCWLKFKGGKGIATSAGVMLALAPAAGLTALALWILVFAASRYVSLASIVAAASLPFAAWFWNSPPLMIYIFAGLGALAIYKHKSNIERLLKGTENRIGKPKAS